MIVSLNSQFFEGPYGGGMNFAFDLKNYLEKQGVTVINHLHNDNIDIIFNINPFPFLLRKVSAYSFFDAYLYQLKHQKTSIFLQVNECDERKNTHFMNHLLIEAGKYSDYIVYIANWLKPLLERQGLDKKIPSQVILHGVNTTFFNMEHKVPWHKKSKLRIVTHHWSGNYFKGHDIYQELDMLLNKKEFSSKFEFTFIGNVPKNIKYKNTTILKPMSGKELADELKKHHVYLTASRNEPAGMHHIEGASCGLPLLYINSGALPEYCNGYGVKFNPSDFKEKLLEMYKNYDHWYERIKTYKRSAEGMGKEHYELFKKCMEIKQNNQQDNSLNNVIKAMYMKPYTASFDYFWKLKTKYGYVK